MYVIGLFIGIFSLSYLYRYKLLKLILGSNSSYILFNNNHIEISYSCLGEKYFIRLPYNPRNKVKMIQFKAELISGDKKIDITQQPGIPYLINAKDLCGEKIILTNLETGEYHEYTTAPLYGIEIME